MGNIENSETQAKLIEAARYGSEGGVRFFIKRVENVDGADERGWTALHWAAAKPSLGCAQILLAGKADPNKKNNDGESPLHLAAKVGNIEVQRLLIKSGADTRLVNKEGRSPMDLAHARKAPPSA